MSKLQEKMQEYVQCLNLPGNRDQIIVDALELLKKLNSNEISTNSDSVASLFCSVICNFTEKQINDSFMSGLVWESYCNIKDLEYEESRKPSVEIVIIHFLKKINNMCGMTGGDIVPFIDDEMQEQFKVLCSKLEEMKVIFRMRYNEVELFPIGKLLATVIGGNYTFEELDEVTLNTFLLALEIFDTKIYVTEKNRLDEIIKKCNLKCLRYLSNPSIIRIGGSIWKNNFKYNGVLILADVNKRSIYIRHPEKVYFKQLDGNEIVKLKHETNSTGRNIAYYYEYEYDPKATFMSIEDIMLKGTYNMKLAAIREIYNKKLYNAFFDKAFMKIGEEIFVVNFFTEEDKFIIQGNRNVIEANVENITEYAMKQFSLIRIWGKELDCIIVGSVCKLLTISNVNIDILVEELKQVDNSYQNALIQSWLKHSDNVYENMAKLQELYFEDTLYIKKRKDIANKRISDISWIPVVLSDYLLVEALHKLCGATIEDKVELVLLEIEEDFEGNIVYKCAGTNKEIIYENIKIEDKDDFYQGKTYSIKWKDEYFISHEIDNYIRLIRKINDGNRGLHKIESFFICTESQIQIIMEAMKLQEKALRDIAGCKADFDSIARLRIIHHVICNNILNNNQWTNFIEVLNGHQQLKYDFSKETNWPENNILIVPKERQESDSALTSIINMYLKKNAVRNHDFYFSEIGLNQEGYTYREQKIEKIVFLFDTLQSGTSTIRNLKFYFEEYSKTSLDNVQNQHIIYYCKGMEIKLETIIEKNNPIVEVLVLYGSEEGKTNVEKYLSSNPYINSKTVTCMRKIDKIANKDFMNKVFEVYNKSFLNIEDNYFPIIREFNQPKRNAFPKDNLLSENIASIFVKKKEFTKNFK